MAPRVLESTPQLEFKAEHPMQQHQSIWMEKRGAEAGKPGQANKDAQDSLERKEC